MDSSMRKKLGLFDRVTRNESTKLTHMSVLSTRQVMRALGLNPTNREINEMMIEMDQNGNDRLDFQEFANFMANHYHERDQEAELREAFRIFDRDNSGFITISELKQVMLNLGEKLSQEEVEDMMREVR